MSDEIVNRCCIMNHVQCCVTAGRAWSTARQRVMETAPDTGGYYTTLIVFINKFQEFCSHLTINSNCWLRHVSAATCCSAECFVTHSQSILKKHQHLQLPATMFISPDTIHSSFLAEFKLHQQLYNINSSAHRLCSALQIFLSRSK